MSILQLVACACGKHHRDRRRAWFDGKQFRSWCTGCGAPMFRDFDAWHVDRSPEARNLSAPADAEGIGSVEAA